MNKNANIDFQRKKSLSAKLYFIPIFFRGALANSTLRDIFKNQKYDNLTYLSQKLFFNVKILKKLQGF